MENKKWMAFWGPNYAEPYTVKLIDDEERFFEQDNGYTIEEYEAIIKLEIGETWICETYPDHIVTRVQ